MRVYKAIERALEALTVFFWRAFILVHELKNIWAKRALVRSFRPTEEQKREAEEFWRGVLGHGIPLWWHRLYASYTGRWDPRYIPEILFSVRLEPNSSRRADREALDDKRRIGVFAGDDLRAPEEYASCCAGVVTQRGRAVRPSELHGILADAGPCVVKRTRDTSSGRDVSFADFEGGHDSVTGLDVGSVVSRMGGDWVCQEAVAQHPSIAAIHPESVNTMRIVTYLTEHGVGACPVVLRVGRGASQVDNAHAGGMFVHVREDGTLAEEAFTEYQERYREHPDTGIVFAGHRIEGVRGAVNACRRRHLAVGGFGFVSWDVCIDTQGAPVLIEVNLVSQTVWFPQMASGAAMFGDDTAEVVRRYRRGRA